MRRLVGGHSLSKGQKDEGLGSWSVARLGIVGGRTRPVLKSTERIHFLVLDVQEPLGHSANLLVSPQVDEEIQREGHQPCHCNMQTFILQDSW